MLSHRQTHPLCQTLKHWVLSGELNIIWLWRKLNINIIIPPNENQTHNHCVYIDTANAPIIFIIFFYKHFYLFLAYGQRTPTISHITQQQIRDIGGQVDLDCSVHYANDYPVLWVSWFICVLSIYIKGLVLTDWGKTHAEP